METRASILTVNQSERKFLPVGRKSMREEGGNLIPLGVEVNAETVVHWNLNVCDM